MIGLSNFPSTVLAQLHAGKKYETEEGPCRKCGGTGRIEVFVRSTCFGSETRDEECLLCHGSGTDKKRIKVPDPS